MNNFFTFILMLVVSPVTVFAATSPIARSGLLGIIAQIGSLVSSAIPVIIALAVALFLWGIIKYVTSGDAKDKEAAKGYMIWGIIALFVMVSVWGLVKLLSDTFGTGSSGIAPTTYSF